MAQDNSNDLFDILSEVEGNSFILEDVENLLNIFDNSITDIISFVNEQNTFQAKLTHASLTEIYSLLIAIRLQVSSATTRLQTAVKNGYDRCRQSKES